MENTLFGISIDPKTKDISIKKIYISTHDIILDEANILKPQTLPEEIYYLDVMDECTTSTEFDCINVNTDKLNPLFTDTTDTNYATGYTMFVDHEKKLIYFTRGDIYYENNGIRSSSEFTRYRMDDDLDKQLDELLSNEKEKDLELKKLELKNEIEEIQDEILETHDQEIESVDNIDNIDDTTSFDILEEIGIPLMKYRVEEEKIQQVKMLQQRLFQEERRKLDEIERIQVEQDRLAKERLEREEEERLEREAKVQEEEEEQRLAKVQEEERLAKERAEQEALEQERLSKELLAKERAEQEAKDLQQERLSKEQEEARMALEQEVLKQNTLEIKNLFNDTEQTNGNEFKPRETMELNNAEGFDEQINKINGYNNILYKEIKQREPMEIKGGRDRIQQSRYNKIQLPKQSFEEQMRRVRDREEQTKLLGQTQQQQKQQQQQTQEIPIETQQNDPIREKYLQLLRKFTDITNSMVTTPVMFKINSMSASRIVDLLQNKRVTIGNNNIPYRLLDLSNKEVSIPETFKPVLDFLYVDITKIINGSTEEHEYMNNEINQLFTQDELKKDTQNVFEILKAYEQQQNQQNQTIIHITKLLKIMNQISKDYETINRRFGTQIFAYFHMFMTNAIEKLNPILDIIKILEYSMNFTNFKRLLETVIQKDNENKIITFLKITNHDKNTYNKRFNIQISKERNGIMVKYNPDNFPYYKIDENKNMVLSNEILEQIQKNPRQNQKQEQDQKQKQDQENQKPKFTSKDNITLQVNEYDQTYMYGKFTKIYTPDQINSNIASNMKTVVKNIIDDGKTLFLLGYGASGAGKTSSLIYYNGGKTENEKQGILIHLCILLGKEGYSQLELISKEFFTTNNTTENAENRGKTNGTCDGGNTLDDPMNCDSGKYNFQYKNTTFVLDPSQKNQYENKHKYRSQQHVNPFEKAGDTTLGETMIYLIDTDRYVKATTNNPNSSRSHVIVYVKLTNPDTGKTANLIVGDFAGVENTFQCENIATVNSLLNIKRDKSDELYYSSELKGSKNNDLNNMSALDPVYGGAQDDEQDDEQHDEQDDEQGDDMFRDTIEKPDETVVDADEQGDELFRDAISEDSCKLDYFITTDKLYDFMEPRFRKSMNDVFGDKFKKYEIPVLNKILTNLFGKDNTDFSVLFTPVNDYNGTSQSVPQGQPLPKTKNNNEIYNFISMEENMDEITENYHEMNEVLLTFENFSCDISMNMNPVECDTKYKQLLEFFIHDYLEIPVQAVQPSAKNDQPSAKNDQPSAKNDQPPATTPKLSKDRSWVEFLQGKAKTDNLTQPAPSNYAIELLRLRDDLNHFKEYRDQNRLDKMHNTNFASASGMFMIKSLYRDLNENDTTQNGKFDSNTIYKKTEKRDDAILIEAAKEIQQFNDYLDPKSRTYYKLQFENINKILMDGVSADEWKKTYVFYYKHPNPKYDFFPIKIEYTLGELITGLFDTYFYDLFEVLDYLIKPPTQNQTTTTETIPVKTPTKKPKRRGGYKTMKNTSIYIKQNRVRNRSEKKQYKTDKLDPNIYLQIMTHYKDFHQNVHKLRELYKQLYTVIVETKCRIGYGQQVCENRNVEGAFINDSLSKVRNTIKEIMIEKNKDVIFNSVDYIDVCLDTYCPNHSDCFTIPNDPSTSNESVVPSIIFTDIMELLNANSGKKYETKNEFYNDIVVGIFCVLNISRTANNPPPVPYIDINALKTMYYNKTNYTKAELENMVILFEKTISQISRYQDKVGYIVSTVEYKNATKAIEDMKRINGKMTTTDIYKLNENQVLEQNIEKFIQLIDKNNAASAIGTLEFVDQMAKFNSINNVCYTEDNAEISTNLVENYKKTEGFTDIM